MVILRRLVMLPTRRHLEAWHHWSVSSGFFFVKLNFEYWILVKSTEFTEVDV